MQAPRRYPLQEWSLAQEEETVEKKGALWSEVSTEGSESEVSTAGTESEEGTAGTEEGSESVGVESEEGTASEDAYLR